MSHFELFPPLPSGWTPARLTKLLNEERGRSYEETQRLDMEVEDLEESLIKALEMIDAEREWSKTLEAEADRLTYPRRILTFAESTQVSLLVVWNLAQSGIKPLI